MLLPLLGFAQARPAKKAAPAKKTTPAPAPAANRWPIQRIVIEGNRLYTPDQVIAASGLKIGQVAGKEEFDAAYNRLLVCGAFETLSYKFAPATDKTGFVATFQVTEVEPAYPVHFEELGVPDKDVEAMLHTKDPLFGARIPATKTVLAKYTGWIQEFLATRKLTDKIAGRVAAVGPDQFVILFRPERNLPAVAQVTFDGNKVIPNNLLRDAIGGVAIGQPYTEERFRGLLETGVRPLYETRGRLRVAFTKVRTEPAKDVQGLHVFVTVDEGESFDLGDIAIEGPVPVKPDALLKAGNLKPGDLANFEVVGQALEKMRAVVRRAGYMQAKVTAARKLDDAKKTVALAIHVDAGPPYTMGTLTIDGLDINGEYEMKRIWAMKEGKPYNAEYPDSFLNRVREEGLFDNLGKTRAEVKVNEQTHVVDVILHFGGAPLAPDRRRRPQGPPI